MPPPPTEEDSFLDDMAARLDALKNCHNQKEEVKNPTMERIKKRDTAPVTIDVTDPPHPPTSPIPTDEITPTGTTPFIKRATLPREPFFVQLKGFSLIGDVAYFTMIDEGWWSLYAFVMKFIRSEFNAGRLPKLPPSEITPSKHVVVHDEVNDRLIRGVIMGVDGGGGEGLVEVRDVDEAMDTRIPASKLYTMPEEGLAVPFRALKVTINGTQLFTGSDTTCRLFESTFSNQPQVFRAVQVTDRCGKRDSYTLEMYTPLRENVGEVLVKGLGRVCCVPVPEPSTLLTVLLTHYTTTGLIYYQSTTQSRLLQIIQDFDVIVRTELPGLREVDSSYSNEQEVRQKLKIPGTIFAARYSDDGRFYRGEVLGGGGWGGGSSLNVHFIDYGNEDEVNISDVVLLDGFDVALVHIPRMCRALQLASMDCLDPDRMDVVLGEFPFFKIRVHTTTPTVIGEVFTITKDPAGKEVMQNLSKVLEEVKIGGE